MAELRQLTGLIHGGRVSRDPFDRRLWSSISYHLFSRLRDRGRLHRAVAVEVPGPRRFWYLAKNFRADRSAWRKYFSMDPAYREALSRRARKALVGEDLQHDVFQIGAMFRPPRGADSGQRFYSYHDGNLAESLRSPYAPSGLNARAVERGLAFERQVYGGMTKLFVMSEYLRKSFVDDFGIPREKVFVVGCGVNLDHLPPARDDKAYDTQEVLFIGVDFTRKGGPQLLRAFQGVRHRLPKAQLHVVGPRRPPTPDQAGVTFHGFLDKAEDQGARTLDDLFRRCCLFVLPSLYEPFGIAPLEAMAHQIPCLVTNRWALKETVVPGGTGDHVECGSVEDLEAKLIALLGNPDALRRMGSEGRGRVLGYYTWDKAVSRIVQELSE